MGGLRPSFVEMPNFLSIFVLSSSILGILGKSLSTYMVHLCGYKKKESLSSLTSYSTRLAKK